MLVWDELDERLDIFATANVARRSDAFCAFDNYFRFVNRIVRRDSERLTFVPSKLSAAMIGAFKSLGSRVGDSIETSYAQWQQYVGCAMWSMARRRCVAMVRPLKVTPFRAVRRVGAFFVSQKVNGRNAP